jgi:hypothetical protein
MADIVIRPKNPARGGKDVFVGMEFERPDDGAPSVKVTFPFGYHYAGIDDKKEQASPETQAALKKELYALLCAIRRHSQNSDGELTGNAADRETSGQFPFDAYIAVIRDFMRHGYYIESEIRHRNAPTGKINWRRTIARVRPTLRDDGSPVYTDFIIRQNAKKTDNLISLIHEWCVHEAFTTLGWIFTSFNPREPALEISEGGKERAVFVSVIIDSLKTTFNDRNRTLFNAMIAMLRHDRSDGKSAFFYGTEHFHTVWENLIDTSYGVSEGEKVNYFPRAKWVIMGKEKDADVLRPDTIMRLNGRVFVLDAKYYSFILDGENLPGVSDINKQVTYGAYACQKSPNGTPVYNAFLIPYDFERDPRGLLKKDNFLTEGGRYGYLGFSYMDAETPIPPEKYALEKYKLVLGILIDTKWLIQNAGRADKEDLAKFIIKSYESAEADFRKVK